MSDYLKRHGGSLATPQSEPLRPDQVENSAGGFVWAVDRWTRLHRFLILGSEGGSYYASERQLTLENVGAVRECIAEDGARTVATIVAVSQSGAAPKNEPALYALAAAISHGDYETKLAAGRALPLVARTGTHLFHFVAYAKTMRGWGRMLKKAVAAWYEQPIGKLALQAVKYRQRDGWSHRDLLRLTKLTPVSAEHDALFAWITARGGKESLALELVDGYEQAQAAKTPAETAALVRRLGLPRETLRTDHLGDREVWLALLEARMPLTAMIRNLANMTRLGVFESRTHLELVEQTLGGAQAIREARVHPMTLLVALRAYAAGHGMRGGNTWQPLPRLVDALDESFYLAFANVEPTGKRTLLALDVSGSMGLYQIAGSFLTPREASVAMALVTLHAEPDVDVVGFSGGMTMLDLSRRQRLDDAIGRVCGLPFDRTDCALPFLWALENGKSYESFAVYTDSETWAGSVHPKQALDAYRRASGLQARSAVVGMVSNGFSIADPNDPGMLDVVGFDTAAPALMSTFFAGRL